MHTYWLFHFNLRNMIIRMLKNSGHDNISFKQEYDHGVNEVLCWFGINLMVSFQDTTQNIFCILAKISHPAVREIYYFNLSSLLNIDDTISVCCAT